MLEKLGPVKANCHTSKQVIQTEAASPINHVSLVEDVVLDPGK